MPNLRMPLLTGAALLVLGPSVSSAQEVPSPYRFLERGQEAHLFAGLYDGDRGRFGFGPGSGTLYGARYSVSVSGPLAVEAVASYVDADREVVNPRAPGGPEVIAEAPGDLLFIDARLRLSLTGRRTWYRMMPYLFAGGGLGFGVSGITEADRALEAGDRYEFGTEFEANIGGGVRFHLDERLALRLDGTLMLFRIDVPPGYRDPELDFEAVPESEWTNNRGLTLGLSYLF